MPSDIRVQQIRFAQPIFCNCPTVVDVVLINLGNAPPAPISGDGRFEVCLQSPAFRAETDNVYRQRVLGGERANQLLPGQTLTVTFHNVVFLRAGRQEVTGCADCKGVFPQVGPPQFEIGNDVHRKPCLKVKVDIIPAAWLQVDRVEIDLEDSLGNRSRNVTRLCAGSNYVAIATVRNRGCFPARNFAAELVVLDQNGNTLATITQVVPAVNPNIPVDVEFRGTVPVPNAPGAAYTFRACVDVTNLVQPQCNRALLCLATAPILVVPQGGPGPTVSLIVNSAAASPLFPGQDLPIAWTIQNTCADLGNVTARVTLKATGDLLYDSALMRGPIPVPPQASGGEPLAFIRRPVDPNVAAALYSVGAKRLRLEVTGTGRDPGPYVAEAPLVITAENPDAAWWSWNLTGTNLHWKDPYNVGGTLTNRSRGRATLNVTSVTFREFDDEVAPPAPTGDTFAVPPPFASLAPSGAIGFVWTSIVQDWDWFDPTTFQQIGPTRKSFGYEADIQLTDEFGNAYHPLMWLDPWLEVSPEKLARMAATLALLVLSIALAMMAVDALALPFIGGFLAAGLFIAAAAAYAGAVVVGLTVNDPPVPDFQYLEIVSLVLRPLPKALGDLPADLAPLRSLAELLNRFAAAVEAHPRIVSKVLGARIDNHAEGLREQANAYRQVERLLGMVAAHFPAAVAETLWALKARKAIPAKESFSETLAEWRRDGLPASVRDRWLEAGLPEDTLARMAAVIRTPDALSEIPSFETCLQRVADGIMRIAHQVASETPNVLGGLEASDEQAPGPVCGPTDQ